MMDDQLSLICPPVRTHCFPDENPISYLVRLARLNNYPSYRWLLTSKNAGTINYELLHDTLLENEWVGNGPNNFYFREICSLPNIHINSSFLRYCPLCLKEEGYWRIGWQLKLSVACNKHKIWLHDVCPHCQKNPSIMKVDEKQLKCLEQLPNAATETVPGSVLIMQKFLEHGFLSCDNDLIEAPGQLSNLERSEFILFMLKWQELDDNQANPAQLNFKRVNDFKDRSVRISDALFSSQDGFWRYLQMMHLTNASYIGVQQKRLVNFYREFFNRFPTESFEPLRILVEKYATKNLIRDITQKHTYFSQDARINQIWYSFQKACKEYNIAGSVLSRAITDKQVKAHFEGDGDYTKCSIYRPDLEKVLPHLKGLIPASDAAEILGVTKAQFTQLQNCGCFKFETPPRQDYCSTWQYSQQELATILENLNLGAAPLTSDCLTLSQIMQHHIRGTVEMPFLQVFKAILAGQLIVRKAAAEILKIRTLSIDKEEIMRWLDNLRPDPGYLSITEAAKLIGVNEEFAYQLVRRGHLHHKVDSRKAKVIFPDHIRQFYQEYVILSKLSEKAKLNSATTTKVLRRHEIFPVDHNSSSKLRQKLYYRADILKTEWFYRCVKYLPE